ncbi:hypothetical protein [Mucilaginibacter sp.]|uniref:hypothetical protein n=1 Tax=Mucilaginibacter sp. TaxID=1882438 RepID=UPI00283B4F1D|nr:hypothetical protein [Mucilaginibacter sp.]MDR3693001.1 hypothetical protein [Mucilaginibacter sp.]
MKKIILLLFISGTCINLLSAQSIVGSWKTISNTLVNSDGSADNLTVMQQKQWPCMADIQTIFEASGKQYMKSPKNCGPFDFSKVVPSTWKMLGNTISITNTSMPNPLGKTATYTVAFAGNTATFTHEYTAAEKAKLHSKAIKKVIITYQRV